MCFARFWPNLTSWVNRSGWLGWCKFVPDLRAVSKVVALAITEFRKLCHSLYPWLAAARIDRHRLFTQSSKLFWKFYIELYLPKLLVLCKEIYQRRPVQDSYSVLKGWDAGKVSYCELSHWLSETITKFLSIPMVRSHLVSLTWCRWKNSKHFTNLVPFN